MKTNRFYFVCRAIVLFLLSFLFPFRASGRENIPAEGPVLLCSNHVSLIDPLFIACSTKRYIRFISKKELFSNRFFNWLFTHLGMFPVDRGGSDLSAMRTSLAVLKEGGALGIFPQGHRYRQDDNRDLETGAAIMALRARVPVIPIHVRGPVRLFRRNEVRFGKPLDFSDLKRLDAPALAEAGRRLAEGIWGENNTN
ncbi:MAG: 1-acyl-sn-glycerol-3-phosphate acyltransferase [Clostridia bacterium]|nr:1-acyl-sn-glycerol-3-phosphate acyltransferase [Clostridia bacterium]